ncbi:hypothetical protein ES703_25764 [subsurface metagenome]
MGVFVTRSGIGFEALHLGKKNGRLVFHHPAVCSDDGVPAGFFYAAMGPAAVMVGETFVHDFLIVSDEGPAFTAGQMF